MISYSFTFILFLGQQIVLYEWSSKCQGGKSLLFFYLLISFLFNLMIFFVHSLLFFFIFSFHSYLIWWFFVLSLLFFFIFLFHSYLIWWFFVLRIVLYEWRGKCRGGGTRLRPVVAFPQCRKDLERSFLQQFFLSHIL